MAEVTVAGAIGQAGDGRQSAHDFLRPSPAATRRHPGRRGDGRCVGSDAIDCRPSRRAPRRLGPAGGGGDAVHARRDRPHARRGRVAGAGPRAARLHREGAGGCRGRHARGRGRDVDGAARQPADAVDARAGDAEPRLARLRLDDAPPRGVSADAGAPAGHRHARRFDHALLGRRAGRRPPHRRRGVGPLLCRSHRRQPRLRVGSHGERALAPGERRVRGRDAEGGGADDRHQQHHAQYARRDCRRRRRPSARRFTSGRRRRRFSCSRSSRAASSPTPRAPKSTT